MRAQHRSFQVAILVAATSLIVAASGSGDASNATEATETTEAESTASSADESSPPAAVLDPSTVGDATLEVWTSEGGSRLEIVPLAPGEPTPAGAVGCMLVATDVQSSVAMADLIGKRARKGQKS